MQYQDAIQKKTIDNGGYAVQPLLREGWSSEEAITKYYKCSEY
jgi:hypothetical protein